MVVGNFVLKLMVGTTPYIFNSLFSENDILITLYRRYLEDNFVVVVVIGLRTTVYYFSIKLHFI